MISDIIHYQNAHLKKEKANIELQKLGMDLKDIFRKC